MISQQPCGNLPSVALWRWSLLARSDTQAELWDTLSQDEQARADRFYFPDHRRRYIVGRGTLRVRLAAYLNCAAKTVALSYNEFGKPTLKDPDLRTKLSFNLSHCDDLAVLAVADGSLVGVDIERVRPITEDFANHYFATDELAMLATLPRRSYAAAVFACWTRKEAYLKAVGAGLSLPLDSFAVSIDPSLPAQLMRIDGGRAELYEWTLAELSVASGYAAAAAVRQRGAEFKWVAGKFDWAVLGRMDVGA